MKKRIVFAAVAILAAAALSAVVGGDLGGDVGDGDVFGPGSPPDDDCICPAVFDPVVCEAPGGGRQAYSNACVAACNNATNCVEIAIAGL